MATDSLPKVCLDLLIHLERNRCSSRITTDVEMIQRFDEAIKALGDKGKLLSDARRLLSLEDQVDKRRRQSWNTKQKSDKQKDKNARTAYQKARKAFQEAIKSRGEFVDSLRPSAEIVRSIAYRLTHLKRPKGMSDAEAVEPDIKALRADLERRQAGYVGLPDELHGCLYRCITRGLVERFDPLAPAENALIRDALRRASRCGGRPGECPAEYQRFSHVRLTDMGRAVLEERPHTVVRSDDEAGKKRPCYARDHLWLSWYESNGQDTHKSHAKIRDKWNGMSDEERLPYAPGDKTISEKQKGRDVVKQAIKLAQQERKSETK